MSTAQYLFSVPLFVFHHAIPFSVPLFYVSTAQYVLNLIICVSPPSTFFSPIVCFYLYHPVRFQFRCLWCTTQYLFQSQYLCLHHPVPFQFHCISPSIFVNLVIGVHHPVPFQYLCVLPTTQHLFQSHDFRSTTRYLFQVHYVCLPLSAFSIPLIMFRPIYFSVPLFMSCHTVPFQSHYSCFTTQYPFQSHFCAICVTDPVPFQSRYLCFTTQYRFNPCIFVSPPSTFFNPTIRVSPTNTFFNPIVCVSPTSTLFLIPLLCFLRRLK